MANPTVAQVQVTQPEGGVGEQRQSDGKQDPQKLATKKRLVEQLGSDSYPERKSASAALAKIGEPALETLERAANVQPDAEIRVRAAWLRGEIRRQSFGEVRQFNGRGGPVHAVAFSPDGRSAFSGSEDGMIRVWDVETGTLRSQINASAAVWSLAVAVDEKTIIASGADRVIRSFDLESGKEVRQFAGHRDWVLQTALSSDGSRLLSGSHDSTMRMWAVATGRELAGFAGHRGSVYAVAVSPDGRRAVSGSADNFIRIWDMAAGTELRRLVGHAHSVWALAFSPSNEELLSASADGTLRLWEVETGKPLWQSRHRTLANHVVFMPDGKRFLTASGHETGDPRTDTPLDNIVTVWNALDCAPLHIFRRHVKTVHDVAISPDGRYALSGSADGTARLWALPK